MSFPVTLPKAFLKALYKSIRLLLSVCSTFLQFQPSYNFNQGRAQARGTVISWVRSFLYVDSTDLLLLTPHKDPCFLLCENYGSVTFESLSQNRQLIEGPYYLNSDTRSSLYSACACWLHYKTYVKVRHKLIFFHNLISQTQRELILVVHELLFCTKISTTH